LIAIWICRTHVTTENVGVHQRGIGDLLNPKGRTWMAWSKKTCLIIVIVLVLATAGPVANAQQSIAVIPSEISAQKFLDPASGVSAIDLVRRALATYADLTASRLEVARARGRLRQAGLIPNPVVDIEQTTGRWTGSAEEKEQSIGLLVPVELGGKRARRIDLGRADLAAAEAEVEDRERRLTAEVRTAFSDALAALRELGITSELNRIDRQTAQFVLARVTEGDAAPLELSLLRADADRLRSRRALIEGRLQAAVLKLKNLAGIPASDELRFREELEAIVLPDPPSLEEALETALRARPDLRLARLNEQVSEAGMRLARAQVFPDVTLSVRYSTNTTVFDQTPVGVLRDRDKVLSFGASISIPIFNRNQGATMEAQAAIAQARARREFLESLVRAEVASAHSRYQAARDAVTIFEPGVIERSEQNIRAVRGAYEIGAFRITDLLTEQRRLVDFQREYTDALAERYRALADLQAAMGTPVNP
jgi:cobalt-zinc-cadmium efflux system outer membrane protein